MKKNIFLVSIVAFIVILSALRLFWMDQFWYDKHLEISRGQLDIRNWDQDANGLLLLDGEWEFIPYRLVESKGESSPTFIQVPGNWNNSLHPKSPSPYGYASYRLRLYVNPEMKRTYGIRVPSIRSASSVYVNGRLLGGSGKVAETKEMYEAKNQPYSIAFTADENGIIEIIVQVANFVDARESGIIRSLKFGTEDVILKDIKWSASMQMMMAIVFLLHGAYAVILYILGNRDKRLLYFSVFLVCITLNNLFSTDEKFLHIGYDWDFKLTNIFIIIGFYSLLQCTDHIRLLGWCRVFPVYRFICFITVLGTLFLSSTQIIHIIPVYFSLALIAVIISVIVIYKKISSNLNKYSFILFSFIALIHQYVWVFIWEYTGVNVVYYPIDFIIALGCFSSVVFQAYFNVHTETKMLSEKLQRMNESKDQFLANTAHEFKNPLHGILNMSQSILQREKLSLGQESVKELEMMLTVGSRMNLLLNDLLDEMSIKEGKHRLQKGPVFIQAIIPGVIDLLRFTLEVKHIRIIEQVPEDFPPVLADENRLIQIVYNLLHNALKYTHEGTITIQAKVVNEKAIIAIVDTGIGMDDDLKGRLFHPYEQGGSGRTLMESGFGLGLSITKKLVELHGGILEVTSVLDEGSKFSFTLDLLNDRQIESVKEIGGEGNSFSSNAIDEIASEPSRKIDGNSIVDELPRILAVDDDPINLQVLKAILPSDQYNLTTVTDAKSALDLLDDSNWDLVISDVMMPKMSGIELVRKIRFKSSLAELPVLLLTAKSRSEDIQSGFLAGANDYVPKPVEPIEIRSRINALVSSKRMLVEQIRLEAAWLQAQIQPHFIFNTLNTAIALSKKDLDKMHLLLEEFSNLLRYKFMFHHMDDTISIEDELEIVKSYLYIEQIRFGERLQVNWKVEEFGDMKVPFLSIQTLVENAIRHGLMKKKHGGTITISISVNDFVTTISVIDDGVGMDSKTLQGLLEKRANKKQGVGILNTHQRLKRHFGTGLQITSQKGQGTVVVFNVHAHKTN